MFCFFFNPQLDLVNILQISTGTDSSTLSCLGNEEKMTFANDKSETVLIHAGLRSRLKTTWWMSPCIARRMAIDSSSSFREFIRQKNNLGFDPERNVAR